MKHSDLNLFKERGEKIACLTAYDSSIAKLIDDEVRRIIDETYESATNIINEQINRLHKMAEALLKYETIEDLQIKDIMNDKEPRPPEDWDSDDDSSEDNNPTDIGGPATQH